MRDRIPESAGPLLALLFAALCMNFSWVHGLHDGDSILSTFISTDRWTPFYWGDNRYGMPVAWLSSWIRDPVLNLLSQTQIFSLSVIAVLLATNLFFFHAKDSSTSVRVGTACMAFVLCLLVFRPTQRTARIFFLTADPYLISLLPLLLAIVVVFRTSRGAAVLRFAIALSLVFISLWINYSHVLLAVLLPLLIAHGTLRWRQTLPIRFALAAGSAGIFLLIRYWASRYPAMGAPAPAFDQWFSTASRLIETTTDSVVRPVVFIALLAAGTVAGWALHKRGEARWHDGLVFGGCALLFAATVAASDWPSRNGYEPRYWTTPLTLILLVATAWAGRVLFRLLENLLGSRRLASHMAALLVVAVVLRVFGLPDPVRTRALLIETTARAGRDAVALSCTHMVGDYHVAWLAVFYARATGHAMWAAVPRGEVVRDLWETSPADARRYCATVQNPVAIQRSFVLFGLGLPTFSGSSGRMHRFGPAPE